MRAFDLILFDLDGTLVETAPEILDAVNDTLRRFDLPQVTLQQVSDWIGHGTRELLVQALSLVTGSNLQAVRQSRLLAELVAVYDCFYTQRCGTHSQLYPRVRESLQRLREQGVRLALVTNKEARYTQVVLDVHQLEAMFERVICGDTLATKKPDPSGVAQCLTQLGVTASRTLFVGDSSIDAATARNAGVAVWLLPYGYNMGQPIEACRPDRVIRDFSELTSA